MNSVNITVGNQTRNVFTNQVVNASSTGDYRYPWTSDSVWRTQPYQQVLDPWISNPFLDKPIDPLEINEALEKIQKALKESDEYEFSGEEAMAAFAMIAGAVKELNLPKKELLRLYEALNIVFEIIKEKLCQNLPY